MGEFYSFQFQSKQSNQELARLLQNAGIPYSVENDGSIRYEAKYESVVGNELIRKIRDRIIHPWQILSCTSDWVERYRDYMKQHKIPFSEERIDHQICFLVPLDVRPHAWHL